MWTNQVKTLSNLVDLGGLGKGQYSHCPRKLPGEGYATYYSCTNQPLEGGPKPEASGAWKQVRDANSSHTNPLNEKFEGDRSQRSTLLNHPVYEILIHTQGKSLFYYFKGCPATRAARNNLSLPTDLHDLPSWPHLPPRTTFCLGNQSRKGDI